MPQILQFARWWSVKRNWSMEIKIQTHLYNFLNERSYWKFRVLSYICYASWKVRKFSLKVFGNKTWVFSPILEVLTTSKAWNSILIDTFILHLLLKTNRWYLKKKNWLRGSVSRKPLFLTKTGKHEVNLTSFVANLSEPARFPVVGMCQLVHQKNTENLGTVK